MIKWNYNSLSVTTTYSNHYYTISHWWLKVNAWKIADDKSQPQNHKSCLNKINCTTNTHHHTGTMSSVTSVFHQSPLWHLSLIDILDFPLIDWLPWLLLHVICGFPRQTQLLSLGEGSRQSQTVCAKSKLSIRLVILVQMQFVV